ncbi:MAG: hypothetical protein ACRDFX_14580, partial [Chloroflexota bacterium]
MATPPLQIGWYTTERHALQRLPAYQAAGVNLMIAYRSGEPYTSRWLRAAEAHHVKVLLQPDWRWIAHGNLSALQRFVRRYRGDPALSGWYLYDEPEVNRLEPRKLAAAYNVIKSIDRHPVAVVFSTGGCRFGAGHIDPAYLKGFDLLMFDIYPFYARVHVAASRVSQRDFGACVQSARRFHKSGPIIVVQAFGNGMSDGRLAWRDPTFAELQCQVRLARNAG